MPNFRILAALMFAAFALGGCASTQFGQKVENVVRAVTTTIDNPVGKTDVYRVKNAYAAALELAVEYRAYCWGRSYAALMADPVAAPICERRRAVVRAFQRAKANARAAIVAAENFIRDNPTLNAATAIGAALQAVTDFQGAVPVAKAK